MNPFIETHCHLTWGSFQGDVDNVITRARKAGIIAILDLGTDLSTSQGAKRHAETYPDVSFGAGIHPNDAAAAREEELAPLRELLHHPKCVALGEIGLDFFRDYTSPELQDHWLRIQLRLAKELQKPVVLHDRKATKQLLRVLDEESYDGITGPGGVFHCFAGSASVAEEVLERGFYISFTGNLTFKKSDRPEVAKKVVLERLMLETDSPFMAPVPKRGKRNEPAYIPYIAGSLAEIKGVSLETIAQETTANAIRLFHFRAEKQG